MTFQKKVSLVIPCFNEEETILPFLEETNACIENLPYEFEFIFVNDGSRDKTSDILIKAHLEDPRIHIIEFARNFGKESALAAGLNAASGDAVIPIDADLQHPPQLIVDFVKKWEEGYDVVIGVREQRQADSFLKRATAGLFYRFFNFLCGRQLPPNVTDFRLMDRSAVDALNSLPERVRFTKGLYAWIGFKQAHVLYECPPRVAGTTKFNGWKLWNFALDGITSFSTLPLRIWSYIGTSIALIGFLYAIYLVFKTLIRGIDVPGYTSLMVALLVIGGLILISLGIIGEYLGRIFEETKKRPLYVIRHRIGFDR